MAALLLLPSSAAAQINVLTHRYDSPRTGANLSETALTSANVNPDQFGKLYSYPVDGGVYAQPLYVRGVTINGAVRNVLYVATMNDKLYAFDADSASPTPLWMRNFTSPPSVTAVPITDITIAKNIIGNVGIQSTPVIDAATGTIYLVVRTKESGTYAQRLHALDITTGGSRPGSPVTITASVPSTAPDSTVGPNGRVITFDPKMQAQRAALALSNGVVLIAWAAHEDDPPYHGWIMGYDASTLARTGVFCVDPDVYGGGIWQGGRAPTIDAAGNAYFATGNGRWDGTRHFGNTLLKFTVSRTALTLVDYFTPGNEAQLTADDDDLSGSGFTLLPGTSLLLGGGKEGVLYLLNANNLGHLVPNDTQIVQRIPVQGGHVMGGAVFWNSATLGPMVYNWSEDDILKSYQLSGGRLTLPAYAQGQVVSPGHPGGSLTVSANGNAAGTGIVWASMPTLQDGIAGIVAGVVRAFDAETLREIWSSERNASRDRLGSLMKFVPPVVVNGKVYVPNHDNAVAVYGRLATAPDFSVAVTPGSRVITPGSSGTFSVTVSAQGGFASTVTLGATGQPSGTTVSFSPSSITGGGTATMTVSVPAGAPAGNFSVTVSGTSGTRVRSAAPVVVSTAAGGSGAIGINFVGKSPTPMAPAETAGVVAKANWNNASGATSTTPLGLVDESGAATSATVNWSAPGGTWMSPISDAAGNYRLMKGYLDTSETSTTTVTVAGLPQRAYDVYVYVDGDNRVYTRTGVYTISGPGITTTAVNLTDQANTNFGGTFARADNSSGNYLKFSINAAGFTLTATPAAPVSVNYRAPVNAIQILPAGGPAPDFTIAVTPGSQTVTRGASAAYTATVGALNGFSGTVNLSVAGAPAGTTTTFTPSSISGSGTATLTVTTTSGTPAGNSTLTIRGTSGSVARTATATLIVNAQTTSRGTIGINFVGTAPTVMGPAETAGILDKANWNNATGATRSTGLPLVDEFGAATSASVTWTANGGWSTPISDLAGNRRLMKGYLDTSSTTVTTVTVAGLAAGAYDVYLYADGDNREFSRTAAYQISGTGVTTTTINLTDVANTNFAGTYTQASGSNGNYVKFSVNAGGFTLTATPIAGTNGTLRAPVNAIQIVPK